MANTAKTASSKAPQTNGSQTTERLEVVNTTTPPPAQQQRPAANAPVAPVKNTAEEKPHVYNIKNAKKSVISGGLVDVTSGEKTVAKVNTARKIAFGQFTALPVDLLNEDGTIENTLDILLQSARMDDMNGKAFIDAVDEFVLSIPSMSEAELADLATKLGAKDSETLVKAAQIENKIGFKFPRSPFTLEVSDSLDADGNVRKSRSNRVIKDIIITGVVLEDCLVLR